MTAAFGDPAVLKTPLTALRRDDQRPQRAPCPCAAVAPDAGTVVTLNVKDFPVEACEPLAVDAVHPDDFLVGFDAPEDHKVQAPSSAKQRRYAPRECR